MSPEEIWHQAKHYLQESGFNIVVRVKADHYDGIVPGHKRASALLTPAVSIILVGFAGNKFWPHFQAFLRDNPKFSEEDENLIDNYTRLKFDVLMRKIVEGGRLVFKCAYSFGEGAFDLDFSILGMLGGLGVPSLLGILLHPEYGTWISLRGAIITNVAFDDYEKPLANFNPCPSCVKPCIEKCPVGSISISGWDCESCTGFRLCSEVCSKSCVSRNSCLYGARNRYSDEQIKYHHEFVSRIVKKYIKNRKDKGFVS